MSMATKSIEASGGKGDRLPLNQKLVDKGMRTKLAGAELAELRAGLLAHPENWRGTGDLQWQLRRHLCNSFEGQTTVHESVQLKLEDLKKQLTGPTDSGVERLLIDQILTCWVDASTLGSKLSAATDGKSTISLCMYYERRYSAAQTRLVRTIEALARVRKLGLPSVQINVAEKQINVAG